VSRRPLETGLTTGLGVAQAPTSLAGTYAKRPTFGIPGRTYLQTDTGTLWLDTGTAWAAIGHVPGDIITSASPTAPFGTLACVGGTASRTGATTAALFAAISTTYGAGDGSTTFGLPDYRSRTLVASGQGAGLTNRVLAATGGEEAHVLSTGEMPSHSHGGAVSSVGNHSHGGVTGTALGGGVWFVNGGTAFGTLNTDAFHSHGITPDGAHNHTITAEGGGAGHNVMQPFAVAHYYVKL